LVAEGLSGNKPAKSPSFGSPPIEGGSSAAPTIIGGKLAVTNWPFAEGYYVKDGKPAGELASIWDLQQHEVVSAARGVRPASNTFLALARS
jgi:hypothetical protein